MLIDFSVANYRSIRERQTLSLGTARGSELQDSNTFTAQGAKGIELLRSSAIYGANAAGKSNLLRALGAMRKIVMQSASRMQQGDSLPVTPFRLASASNDLPSEFEVFIIAAGVRYQYGFTASKDRIHEEWLLAYPKGRPQRWVDRKWDPESGKYSWSLGGNLLGEKQLWQQSTRDNALFLSTAVQLNSSQLQPIYDWFRGTLHFVGEGPLHPLDREMFSQPERQREVVKYLQAADLAIDDIQVTPVDERPIDSSALPEDMPDSIKQKLIDRFKRSRSRKIETVHRGTDGEAVAFDLSEESAGTQRLFLLADPWIDALERGQVLMVDELHNSLHPHLVRFLIGLFHSSDSNSNNAQLIFSTHDSSILDQEILRRDQIWFCDKGDDQGTQLTPLTDFSPRKGHENLQRAYLSGRYGALPYIRGLDS